MPKIPVDTQLETPEKVLHMMFPMLVCAVNRKVNTGNYENVDLFTGVSVPVPTMPEDPKFIEACKAAAELGFGIVSQETGERYQLIKELQKKGRS